MIQSFIFDIGNVLLTFDFESAIEKLIVRDDITAGEAMRLTDALKNRYEKGAMDQEEFVTQAMVILGNDGSRDAFKQTWQDIFTLNSKMEELVSTLKPRYPLYLLSNTSDLHIDFVFERYPVFRQFDDAVYSYRVGAMKPEPEIYQAAIAQLDVKPSETVFIDDLEANVMAAREMGIHSHQYSIDRHEELLLFLKDLGVS